MPDGRLAATLGYACDGTQRRFNQHFAPAFAKHPHYGRLTFDSRHRNYDVL